MFRSFILDLLAIVYIRNILYVRLILVPVTVILSFVLSFFFFFFFKQKTAYEMRISDWSSDVCSSDLFVLVALAAVGVFVVLLLQRSLISSTRKAVPETMGELFLGYRDLIGTPRGQRTYGYVFVNSIFHSGVFTWLGVYFEQRYGLGPVGIGVALLGYGIPGFLFGPLIGRAADRWGRARLLPIGLGLGALGAATLFSTVPCYSRLWP